MWSWQRLFKASLSTLACVRRAFRCIETLFRYMTSPISAKACEQTMGSITFLKPSSTNVPKVEEHGRVWKTCLTHENDQVLSPRPFQTSKKNWILPLISLENLLFSPNWIYPTPISLEIYPWNLIPWITFMGTYSSGVENGFPWERGWWWTISLGIFWNIDR